jgi:hypothetical protein
MGSNTVELVHQTSSKVVDESGVGSHRGGRRNARRRQMRSTRKWSRRWRTRSIVAEPVEDVVMAEPTEDVAMVEAGRPSPLKTSHAYPTPMADTTTKRVYCVGWKNVFHISTVANTIHTI